MVEDAAAIDVQGQLDVRELFDRVGEALGGCTRIPDAELTDGRVRREAEPSAFSADCRSCSTGNARTRVVPAQGHACTRPRFADPKVSEHLPEHGK